jgi:hypothetical protein
VVEDGDAVAAVGEGVDDRATEEAAATGDEGGAAGGVNRARRGGHGPRRIDQTGGYRQTFFCTG